MPEILARRWDDERQDRLDAEMTERQDRLDAEQEARFDRLDEEDRRHHMQVVKALIVLGGATGILAVWLASAV